METDERPIPPAPKKDYAAMFRLLLVAAALIAPPIYLAKNPQDYTPLVQVLISIFLFLLAYWVGYTREVAKAAQRANDRWLPQAESVIFRLMTLRTNVCGFSRSTKSSCSNASCDLPELDKAEMRAVKIKMKADCEASSQRLDDIAHQLEDAIEDWRRFIIANCAGDECQRIWEALLRREERLERQLADCRKTNTQVQARSSTE
ncbi:MAG: hypothetical protein ACKO2G_03100 [Verrucomicrobiales bacterium]